MYQLSAHPEAVYLELLEVEDRGASLSCTVNARLSIALTVQAVVAHWVMELQMLEVGHMDGQR